MTKINNSKILIISENGFEHSELFSPRDHLTENGADVHIASSKTDPIKSWKDGDWGETVTPDLTFDDVDTDDYHALVIPGGQINPDLLRVNEKAVNIVKDFVRDDKIVAAICHGPWVLVEAGAVKGREMTSYKSISTDLKNAGANWVDKDVAVSNGIITSRSPADLEAFNAKIVEEIHEGEHERDGLSKAA